METNEKKDTYHYLLWQVRQVKGDRLTRVQRKGKYEAKDRRGTRSTLIRVSEKVGSLNEGEGQIILVGKEDGRGKEEMYLKRSEM